MHDLRPFFPVVWFGLGIALDLREPAPAWRLLLTSAAVLAALASGWRLTSTSARTGSPAQRRARRSRALSQTASGLALCLAGGLASEAAWSRYRAPLDALPPVIDLAKPEGCIVRLTGRFLEDPEITGRELRAAAETDSISDRGKRAPCHARILLSWPAGGPEGRAGASSDAAARGVAPRSFRSREPARDVEPAHAGVPHDSAAPAVELAGRRFTATARLRIPRNFGNPGAFDAVTSAARRGIVAHGFIKSARLLELSPDPGSRSPAIRLARGYDRIFRSFFPAPGPERAASAVAGPPGDLSAGTGRPRTQLSVEGAVLRASVLGGRSELPAEFSRALVASGIYHILAVSGLQVAVFGGSLLFVLLRTSAPPRLSLLIALSAIVLYGTMVTPSASVRRAVLSAAMIATARLALRRTKPIVILARAALGLLALYPLDLGDPGFQLTFAATAGILCFAPRLQPILSARLGLGALLAASLAAQVATMPLTAFWFQRIVPFGLASNLLAVPLGALAVVLGICLLPARLLGETAVHAVAGLARLTVSALLAIATIPVDGTLLSFRVPPPRQGALVVSVCALVFLAVARRPLLKRAAVALVCGSILWIALPACFPIGREAREVRMTEGSRDIEPTRNLLTIDLIDVGQGDAILVGFPNGATMLVDGGGFTGSEFDVGERVVVPDLLRRGITEIDRVVLTHAHEDHGGGLRSILRTFRVHEFLSPDAAEGRLRAELEDLARSQGARVLRVRRSYRILEGEVTAECLAPFPGAREGPNNDSLVLRIAHGSRSVLLTGDIGALTEARLLASGDLKADILKVAHHGSAGASGSRFLEALAPRLAAISAGLGNRFGHPAPEVVARLRRQRVSLLETGRDGALRLATDGRLLWAGSLRPDHPLDFPGPVLRPTVVLDRDQFDRNRHEADDEDSQRTDGEQAP